MRAILALSSSVLAKECQLLSDFLTDFGNNWSSECSEVESGSVCTADCGFEGSESFFCSCNNNSCYWIPNTIDLQKPDWSFSSAEAVGAKNRHAHLVESYSTNSSWGALWRIRFRTNPDLSWGWALRMKTNQNLANVNIDSYSLHMQFKFENEVFFQNSESNLLMDKSIYEAYVHFSGTNSQDFERFTSQFELVLDYYEINVLTGVTEQLVERLSSCNVNQMANDFNSFPLKFDYEEAEYEYEPEYEEYEVEKQPNVVLITLDDLGMGDVSWLNDYIQMPNLDSLVDESIRLTQAYGHVANTQSRASLVTGKYAWNLGLNSQSDFEKAAYILDEEEFILSQFLQENGYR